MVSDRNDIPQDAPLIAAGQLLADRKAYGLVWFDDDLITRARYGALADFVEIDENICEIFVALIGLEAEFLELKTGTQRTLVVPGVAMATDGGVGERLNLTVLWSEDARQYLLLLARPFSESAMDVELSKQMRARLIAETEVAEKSRALARVNKELAQANRDLEDYASIISHDLKSPLRGLRYLADEIRISAENRDHKTLKDKLKKMQDQTKRMSDLMSALLDYATVGRKTDVVETVDTGAIIETIVASLTHQNAFDIVVRGNWPEVETLRAPLDLVLRNLIDNAIKHHDRDRGQIVVSCTPAEDQLAIQIADDGPGISPEHQASLFLPFRTLSSKIEEGAGMGLTLVHRTVDSVGGALELQSDPSLKRGTIFSVMWPLAHTSA